MLAKTESSVQVDALAGREVIALCETAAGVLESSSIAAAASTIALMWGAEDLLASLAGVRVATSVVSTGLRPLRQVPGSPQRARARSSGDRRSPPRHRRHRGLGEEARDAAASGFCATACIHPSQVDGVRAAYRPTDDEIAWASGVIRAATNEGGVFRYEGRMIDAPLLRHAEKILTSVGRLDD